MPGRLSDLHAIGFVAGMSLKVHKTSGIQCKNKQKGTESGACVTARESIERLSTVLSLLKSSWCHILWVTFISGKFSDTVVLEKATQ